MNKMHRNDSIQFNVVKAPIFIDPRIINYKAYKDINWILHFFTLIWTKNNKFVVVKLTRAFLWSSIISIIQFTLFLFSRMRSKFLWWNTTNYLLKLPLSNALSRSYILKWPLTGVLVKISANFPDGVTPIFFKNM